MDWSYYVESVWRASIPLELVPDLFAWGVCIAVGAWLLRLVIIRRPLTCAAGTVSWLGWLGWQICFASGYKALEAAEFRFSVALEVTDRFAQDLLALVRAWVDFFLPFLSDVCKWALSIWRQLTMRQRLALIGTVLSGYAIAESLRMFRKHRHMVKKVLFHASFLLGGPLIWHLCGLMPVEWLPWCLNHAITTIPTFMSLLVLSQDSSTPRPLRAKGSTVPSGSVAMHQLWLSYWACWPVLAFLEAVVGAVRRLPYFETHGQRHADLQKASLTFVIWLQYWQGSRLFNFTLRSVFAHASILDVLASFFGRRGLQALGVMRGGLSLGGSASLVGMRFITRLTRRLWLFVLLGSAGLLTSIVLVYVFYSVVSIISSSATGLLWCFAAVDAADTLSHGAEEFYGRKLAFWVLAMLWDLVTELPYVGVVLRLFTPFAFSIWLVAGETVLRYLVLPALGLAKLPLTKARAALRSLWEASMAPRLVTDSAEGEDSNEEAESSPDTGALKGLPAGPCAGDTGGAGGGDDTSGVVGIEDTGGLGAIDDIGTPRSTEAAVAGTGVPGDEHELSLGADLRRRRKTGRRR